MVIIDSPIHLFIYFVCTHGVTGGPEIRILTFLGTKIGTCV